MYRYPYSRISSPTSMVQSKRLKYRLNIQVQGRPIVMGTGVTPGFARQADSFPDRGAILPNKGYLSEHKKTIFLQNFPDRLKRFSLTGGYNPLCLLPAPHLHGKGEFLLGWLKKRP